MGRPEADGTGTKGKEAVGYIKRYFPKRDPKYFIQGNKLLMSLSQLQEGEQRHNMLCFTEDQVSAIKVNRHCTCIPLFGTSVASELLKTVSKDFKSFRLWLDPDKRKEAVKQCLNLRTRGYDISPIFSDVDPKELSDEVILSYINC